MTFSALSRGATADGSTPKQAMPAPQLATPTQAGGNGSQPSSSSAGDTCLELTIENAEAPELVPSVIRGLVEFLYGVEPSLDDDSVSGFLFASSFFDIPALTQKVADYCFQSLSRNNAVRFSLMVGDSELGESGKLIADAGE
jgi:hypothetical protein